MTIYTHPDNVSWLQKELDKRKSNSPYRDSIHYMDMQIIADPHLEKERFTGKIIFPKDRFIEYGPEDVRAGLYFGFAKKETERVFYVLNLEAMRTKTLGMDGAIA